MTLPINYASGSVIQASDMNAITSAVNSTTTKTSAQYTEYVGNIGGSTYVTASNVAVPTGATGCILTIIAPGGGGGSGRQGATGTVRCGGGGGASGCGVYSIWIPASALSSTYSVQVAYSGAGGAAVSTADTNGNSGGSASGNWTFFQSGGTAYNVLGGGGGEGEPPQREPLAEPQI